MKPLRRTTSATPPAHRPMSVHTASTPLACLAVVALQLLLLGAHARLKAVICFRLDVALDALAIAHQRAALVLAQLFCCDRTFDPAAVVDVDPPGGDVADHLAANDHHIGKSVAEQIAAVLNLQPLAADGALEPSAENDTAKCRYVSGETRFFIDDDHVGRPRVAHIRRTLNAADITTAGHVIRGD